MIIITFPKSQSDILGDRFTLMDCLTDVAEPTQYTLFDPTIKSPFSVNDENRHQMIERIINDIWYPSNNGDGYTLCFDPGNGYHSWLVEDAIEGATALARDSYVLCNKDISLLPDITEAQARWKIARRIERKLAKAGVPYQFPRY